MKKCSYCGNLLSSNISREHVIPAGLIKLFPDQKINFTPCKNYKDNEGLTLKDVCQTCNNHILGALDSYGVDLIKNNFMQHFKMNEPKTICFDYNRLSRWLLKIIYNYDRYMKADSTARTNIEYILSSGNIKHRFSIFAGLHADIDPIGEENNIYKPLSIGDNLAFYPNGLVDIAAFEYTGQIKKGNEKKSNFKILHHSFLIRFASIKFLILFWKDNSSQEEISTHNSLIEIMFPYKLIDNNDAITLNKVNSPYYDLFPNIICGNLGLDVADSLLTSSIPNLIETQNHFRKFIKENPFRSKDMIEKYIMNQYNSR